MVFTITSQIISGAITDQSAAQEAAFTLHIVFIK